MNKNKNTKRTTAFLKNTLIALTIAVIGTSATACSMVSGFNKSTAAELIEKDNKYKAPATITIAIGKRLTNAGADTPQTSEDDTAEAAVIRAKEDFAKRQPQLVVAESLGFIKLHFENPELVEPQMGQPGYRTNLKIWTFRPRAEITEAGKKLWANLNLKEDEENLPLAVRSTPEISDLKDESANMKSADFTYKWQTTELGSAFNENSTVFKNLPPNVQQSLRQIQFDLMGSGNNRIMDFDVPRKARAFFQKNKDEWQLGQLYFM